ncbi:Gfo/Idh/MocA family oxidoreductase [Paraglaciecola aquimarina]|uniref:Gfo/Idh/MocA family oxidoreductase n=1 Tax=Paraglaciecola aquimarina TaxID=1235557 RepID=A0ABU3SVT5_9ALTE|nr:Gfo/Idh/MocA family oxidoreductase [Paraglaciecola aquimarina]MDU0354133.1 Gfo/Idh/MocA family oxidoreductase [Paraglaciecola aquimarina]
MTMNKNSSESRREFVKAIGAGVFTVGAGALTSNAMAASANQKKLGIALVGLGNYATNQLAPALQVTENAYLAGIVTGTPAKEKIWADKYKIDPAHIYNYDNFDNIINDAAIDVVYVVLPNSMHKEFVIRAARAGKHVITEKPMGLTAAECEEMIAACHKAGVQLSVGYRLQFEDNTQQIVHAGQSLPLGPINYVRSEFSFIIGNPKQWRLKKELAGGGPIMDIGIYCIQGARMATGLEPIALRAVEYKTDHQKFSSVEETVMWQMEFPGGLYSNSTCSYNMKANELYVSYAKGNARLEPAYSYRGVGGHLGQLKLPPHQVNQQALQMDDFVVCIRQNKTSKVSGEEGLKDMKIVDAMYKSMANGGQRVVI